MNQRVKFHFAGFDDPVVVSVDETYSTRGLYYELKEKLESKGIPMVDGKIYPASVEIDALFSTKKEMNWLVALVKSVVVLND